MHIEPGSTIRKAFLIAGADGQPENVSIVLNGVEFTFSSQSIVTSEFISFYSSPPPSSVNCIDVTNNLNPEVSEYALNVSPQQQATQQGYMPFYLVILYDNSGLPEIATTIVLNEIDVAGIMNYSLSNLCPINTFGDVGFSLVSKHFCDTDGDGSYIHINNSNIGLVGGDDINSQWNCTGVQGHFYFSNGTLGGLSDDIPNNTMSGTDAIANIATYVENNDTELSIDYIYQDQWSETGVLSNPIVANFLAYTTPCQPFETTVTDKVENHCGDTVQLEATGGIAYEWLPQQNLSCYNCPNPIYEGDSSTFYTVRIWNTDSCSKVLPVKINIYEPMQSVNLTTTPATCGENDGALAIGAVTGGQGAYQYRFDENWISNPTWIGFSQLAAGDYTLSVKDQNNCLLQQPFTIGETNPAEAAFTASPSSGYAPLEVDFINQSNGSTDYEWSLVDSIIHSFDFSHTFDSAGSYPVQLVSWYNLPHCADTAATTVLVHPQPPDYNHTIVFPTDYNPQHGPYLVETTNIERMEWQVYNAVGQHIYSTNVETPNGSTALWDGGGHARGYYFFRVQYWDVEGKVYSGRGKVLLMR